MEKNIITSQSDAILSQKMTEPGIFLERPKKIRLREIHTEIFCHLHKVFCKKSPIEKIIHPANDNERCIIECTHIFFRPNMTHLYISNVTDHVTYESAIYLSYIAPDVENMHSFRKSCFTTITFVFSPTPYGDKETDLNGEFVITWHIPEGMTTVSNTSVKKDERAQKVLEKKLSKQEQQTLFRKRKQIINNLLLQQHQWCKPPDI